MNLLGQFLGTAARLVQLMAVLCWGLVLQHGTESSCIYFVFSDSSSNNNQHELRFAL